MYDIGTQCYFLSIRIASLFNFKAKLAINGRRSKLPAGPFDIWLHAASLGEFEQGRPLLEKIKEKYPDWKVLLTFFSPSGFEIRKNYPLADAIAYLPFDSDSSAKNFIRITKPRMAIFIKYEFWFYFLHELHKQHIPTFLVSAIFRPNQPFFCWYGGQFFTKMLYYFDHIFLQEEHSATLLKSLALENYSVSGDTRVDRVLNIATAQNEVPEIVKFVDDKPVLIAGSIWGEDLEILLPLIHHMSGWKIILAPHVVDENNIKTIISRLNIPHLRYSDRKTSNLQNATALIIDNIGMLSGLYRYGRIAYIGGGFGKGIHNILEPMAFGLPVIFGPNYQKFEEARYMIRYCGGYSVTDAQTLQLAFYNLTSVDTWKHASAISKNYLKNNEGATGQIMDWLEKHEYFKKATQI